ncbi:hypothetical protein ACFOLJ_19985 [Rugamonas sp. CCM 8940]|uniref:hypothetical protein n=1 Tax=Rugamonas sp. CCM 8940 TaxID=2765359 RepID=UPI0018F42B8A|nr:hypothetical protein [Rugamonas sp. CCM 8940]MBJ7313848.1 hypothetical protein [Rugamonas sp. CCM 8940]
MRPVGVCLTNTRGLLADALAARIFAGLAASKMALGTYNLFDSSRLFFATSDSLTTAFSGTLGFGRNIFNYFRLSRLPPEELKESQYRPISALHETGNGAVAGNFRVFLNYF